MREKQVLPVVVVGLEIPIETYAGGADGSQLEPGRRSRL